MAFTDEDDVEKSIGVRVENMTADQLVSYFQESQKDVNDIDIPVVGYRDYAVFKKLVADYKQPHAGLLVKWLFWKNKGKMVVNGRKEVVRVSQLSSPWRWLTDALNAQYQMHLKREERQTTRRAAPAGFMTADDL